jgi:hypothetical protein
VQAWAEAATLAKSAVAYNAGALNRAREAGVRYMQVFDGAGCGWTSHKDPDKATGSPRTVEDTAAWPIPHPRCRRAFGPRPDVAPVSTTIRTAAPSRNSASNFRLLSAMTPNFPSSHGLYGTRGTSL